MTHASEPSSELKRLATRVHFAVGSLRRVRGFAGLDTPWEALRHAWALTTLSARHADAVTALAKTDVVLLPGAWVMARAAMEASARAVWLLASDNVWEREARWLSLQLEAARLSDRYGAWSPDDAAQSDKAAQDRRIFVESVQSQLPSDIRIPRVPPVGDMLKPYGSELELFYGFASQYVHGGEYALRHYAIQPLGERRTYGESVSEGDWVPPLRMAWNAFRASALSLLGVAGETISIPLATLDERIHASAQAVLDADTDS